jgi:hypothetical protein
MVFSQTKRILSSLYVCMAIKHIIVLFVETPRKFITAKLSIRKTTVLYYYILPPLQALFRANLWAVILRAVICNAYKEL